MPRSSERNSKLRILTCAAELFAEKGFTETSVRDLAAAVGMKGASIYNHFPSKNAILTHMLEDYSANNTSNFEDKNIVAILRENPTTEGIMACFQFTFPPDRKEYYLKVLCVLLQEQLRNPIVRKYMSEQFILRTERNTKEVINTLKGLGIIRQDTDPDYWMKITSCVLYSFSLRFMLGIGDNAPDFHGMSMVGMLKSTFDLMLEQCGAATVEARA